jgi:hypothetical protein
MRPPPARYRRDLVRPDAARHTFFHFPFLRPQRSQQSRHLCRNISSYCLIQSRCTNSASRFGGLQSIAVSGAQQSQHWENQHYLLPAAGCVTPVSKATTLESPQQSEQAMWRTSRCYLSTKHDSPHRAWRQPCSPPVWLQNAAVLRRSTFTLVR